MSAMTILIPAYEPGEFLVPLVRSIRSVRPAQPIVIVDDGSGVGYAAVFEACEAIGCEIVTHRENRGKGAALKSGFAHIERRFPGADVVCADCDGQHTLVDILRVAEAVARGDASIVLGARRFAGDVPLRSRVGNDITRVVFRAATGIGLQDTQTGLRGYPASMLPWLRQVSGERFEYELEILLMAQRAGHRFDEVPIETIYLADNESSHFHPIKDSIRVYVPFVRFALSSLTAFAIDAALLFTMMALTGQLLLSVVVARLGSASVNFAANRAMVFDRRGRAGRSRSVRRYALLAAGLLATNYLVLATLTQGIGLHLVPAKLLTEAALFVASFHLQRRIVFGTDPEASDTTVTAREPESDEPVELTVVWTSTPASRR